MDTRSLRYFVDVARYGSINRAAKVMYISQPQLSHIIKSIEEEVGFGPFQCTNQGVRLTRNGESSLPYYQIILDETNSPDRFINQTHQQSSRLVASMTHSSHTAVCLNEIVHRHQNQESLFLRLRETDAMDVVDDMTSGYSEIETLHLSVSENKGMLRNFENKRFHSQSITHFKPCVSLSMGHELFRGREARELGIRGLLDYSFTRYTGQYEGFFYHITTENSIVDLNDSAKVTYINDHMGQIRPLTRSNSYTIDIPKHLDEGIHYNVMNVPFHTANEHLHFDVLMRESKRPTGIGDEFIAELKSRYGTLSDKTEVAAQ